MDDPFDSTENVIEIMRQQGRHLKEGTKGKVFGKFSKIKSVMDNIGGLTTAISLFVSEDEETSQLADANKLYENQRYGFEIYNQAYKFRIFEITLSPLYPIIISVDEGVLEDTKGELGYYLESGNRETQYVVKSDSELLEGLKIIFSSKKVRYILYKMQQSAQTKK